MIHFVESLVNEAYRIVESKGNIDDIKASKDLQEINRVMALDMNSYFNIQRGMALDQRLIREYPEIQQMCSIANNMLFNKDEKLQLKSSAGKQILNRLNTDCFGILAGVLVKHKVVLDIKEFIESVSV